METCAQERENTNWQFALTTNVTILCAPLKSIPMGAIAVHLCGSSEFETNAKYLFSAFLH